MMKKSIVRLVSLFALWAVSLGLSQAQEEVKYEQYFADSTLRIDYAFAGKAGDVRIVPEEFHALQGWFGRRHNLESLLLEGTGQIQLRDKASNKVIYRKSFSSLFQEWLSTDEAQKRTSSYENVFLVPYPKEKVIIDIEISNVKRELIAKNSSELNPKDILIRSQVGVQNCDYEVLHRGGDSKEAIDVVILAEGYTKEEMPEFMAYAKRSVKDILAHEPFKSHKKDFNFFAVKSLSKDSGVSVPRHKVWKRTAFASHFDTFYSDRYLTSRRLKAIHNALLGIPYEHIIILANSDVYGGGGVYNSFTLTSTKHRMFDPVVVHEFGHSFGGLADEYFYDEDTMTDTYDLKREPWEQNITTLVDFKGENKWHSLIPKGTPIPTVRGKVREQSKYAKRYPIAVFEGGAYSKKGIYRCSFDCRMRTNEYSKFCPACRLALARLINFYINK